MQARRERLALRPRELAESDTRFETELAEVRRKLDQNAGLIEKLNQVMTGRPHSH